MKPSHEYQSPDEFKAILDNSDGEGAVSTCLGQCPEILYWTLCRGSGHDRYVLREFPLGSRFVTDFVVLNSYSGAWEVKFIELEPVNARLFTRAGVPAKRLAGALKQVDDWADYFNNNKAQVRADLVRWAMTKDILGYGVRSEPCNFSGDRLADPDTVILDSYHIFCGRRSEAHREDLRRKATFQSRHGVEIATYDRLLDFVRHRFGRDEAFVDGHV